MNELAAAAAVVAMSLDDNAGGSLEQRPPHGIAAGSEGLTSMEVCTEADKENISVDAAPSQAEDANPEVTAAQKNHARQLRARNLTPFDCHLCRPRIICAQLSEAVLLPVAELMFPEGQSTRPKAVPKEGGAVPLIIALLINAKAAIASLWKARGYDPNKPEVIKAKLGYALDQYEATAYVVTSRLKLPLLSQPEAQFIGKRIENIIGKSGTVGAKLKALRKRGKGKSAQYTAHLRAAAPLNLSPPPRSSSASSAASAAATPATSVAPVPPPQPTPTPGPEVPCATDVPPSAPTPVPPPPIAGPASAPRPIQRLYGSKEAARAVYTCKELEFQQYDLRQDQSRLALHGPNPRLTEDIAHTQRGIARLEAEYASELEAVKAAFPRAVCCDGFESGTCAHGKPCECGWTQAPWPWIIHRQGGRFCDCHMESRAAWLRAGRVREWGYLSPSGDLGHHLFPNSGPQRGDGS